jgi:hypothetical protein
MRPAAIIVGILATALGLLTMPAGVGAKPRFDVQERSLQSTLSVKGSNGFSGQVTTKGHKQVTLDLDNGVRSIELRTTGRVSRRGISASFGEFGGVSVRFQGIPRSADAMARQRERSGDSEPSCSGRKPILEPGVFQGTIRFRGEILLNTLSLPP